MKTSIQKKKYFFFEQIKLSRDPGIAKKSDNHPSTSNTIARNLKVN